MFFSNSFHESKHSTNYAFCTKFAKFLQTYKQFIDKLNRIPTIGIIADEVMSL